jgi:hypothetical protein
LLSFGIASILAACAGVSSSRSSGTVTSATPGSTQEAEPYELGDVEKAARRHLDMLLSQQYAALTEAGESDGGVDFSGLLACRTEPYPPLDSIRVKGVTDVQARAHQRADTSLPADPTGDPPIVKEVSFYVSRGNESATVKVLEGNINGKWTYVFPRSSWEAHGAGSCPPPLLPQRLTNSCGAAVFAVKNTRWAGGVVGRPSTLLIAVDVSIDVPSCATEPIQPEIAAYVQDEFEPLASSTLPDEIPVGQSAIATIEFEVTIPDRQCGQDVCYDSPKVNVVMTDGNARDRTEASVEVPAFDCQVRCGADE